MKTNLLRPLAWGLLLCGGVASPVCAQWLERSFDLDPGWNALLLDVDPAAAEPDVLVQGLPVQSIWMWNGEQPTAQFVSDPAELLPEDPDWLVWFPPDSPQYAARTLYRLIPGRPYLVKLGGTQSRAWTVTGLPVSPRPVWLPDAFNVVGFGIDPVAPPTFEDFFAPALAHQRSGSLFVLSSAGRWMETARTATMTPGGAFAVFSNGTSDFAGSLTTNLLPGSSVDFGRRGEGVVLNLNNNTPTVMEVEVLQVASAPAPVGEAVVAGPVPLSYFVPSDSDLTDLGEWVEIDESSPLTFEIEPNSFRELRLAVRRADMADPPEEGEFAYQSLLRLTSTTGQQSFIPVRALGIAGATVSGGGAARSQQPLQTGSVDYSGLWLGVVTVDSVSEPINAQNPTGLRPTATEFEFRVLMHVNPAQEPRLLAQAILMNDTSTPGQVEPVVVTDDALLSSYEGSQLRGDSLVGARLSTVNFPFFDVPGEPRNALPSASGSFEDGDAATPNLLTFEVVVAFDDPHNPFVHRFNPDHDNLNFQFQPWESGGEGVESLTIRRTLQFTFEGTDPLDAVVQTGNPAWLSTQVGGTFREEIVGPYRTDYSRALAVPLVTGGTFRMTQIFPGVDLAYGTP